MTTRTRLTNLGASRQWIDGRLRSGWLRRLHRGVYAVGHAALRPEGFFLAATLAVGPRAVLGYESAGMHLRLLPYAADRRLVVLTCGSGRSTDAIRVVRTRSLDRNADVRIARGVRVTSVERTLVDLCDVLDDHELMAVTDGLRHVDRRRLQAAVGRARGRRAPTRLAHLLDGGPRTRSELERAFVEFAQRFELPVPACNVRVAGLLVDCFWADARVVVELDSQSWHAHMGARRNDFDRDARLLRAGYAPLRVTWADLVHQPQRGLARIGPFLI